MAARNMHEAVESFGEKLDGLPRRDAIPKSVEVKQLAAACRAFMEALGVDAAMAYFPLVVTQDVVIFPAVPIATDDDARPAQKPMGNWRLRHPQDDPAGVLTCMVTIKVTA